MADTGNVLNLQLARLVTDELAALHEFILVLNKEQKTLTDGDIDALMPISAEKTRLSIRLGQYTEHRHNMLSAAGFSSDRAGMEGWLTQLPPEFPSTQAARNEWDNLLTLAVEARSLNEMNGNLISTRLQNNHQTLNALLAASNQAALYGPDGQTRAGSSGRLFGSA